MEENPSNRNQPMMMSTTTAAFVSSSLSLFRENEETTTTTCNNNDQVGLIESTNNNTGACNNNTSTLIVEFDSNRQQQKMTNETNQNNNNNNSIKQNNLFFCTKKIPDKLFCREKEISILQDVYERIDRQSQMVLIRGEPGTGKTSFARNFVRRRSNDCNNCPSTTYYFLEGKFEQSHQRLLLSEPNSAFVSALQQFIIKLSVDEKRKIQQTIAEQGGMKASDYEVLIDIIPELRFLETSLKEPKNNQHTEQEEQSRENKRQQSYCDISNYSMPTEMANMNRFKYAFGILLQLLTSCSPNKRIILFFDDIQWAKDIDLDFLLSLINDIKYPGVLVILTYGDIEDADKVSTISSMLEKVKCNVQEIVLERFNMDQLNDILSELFQFSSDDSKKLARNVWDNTKGNLFFIFMYLRALQKDGLIRYDKNHGGWLCDIVDIRIEHYDTFHNLLQSQIGKLSNSANECLKTLSCLGTVIDNKIIEQLGFGPTVPCFDEILQESWLLCDENQKFYYFSHNTIQQVTYGSMSEVERIQYHYRIGKKLWRKLDMDQLINFIFVVVGQLVIAESLMTDPKERTAVSKLCLSAGERSAELSLFCEAREYFIQGINLLDTRAAWRDEYDLILSLYSGAAECSYSSGFVDTVEDFVSHILNNARCFEDTIRVQMINLNALTSSGRIDKAYTSGIDLLKHLGEYFPTRPTSLHFLYQMLRVRRRLKGKSDQSILTLPIMTDPIKLAVMQALVLLLMYAYETNMNITPLIILRMMSVTLEHGLNSLCCIGFALYANALCGFGWVDEGYRFGRLGVALYEKFQNRYFLPRFYLFYYEGVHIRKRPAQECIDPLLFAQRVAMETGDVEFSNMCGIFSHLCKFDKCPLSESEYGLRNMAERMVQMKQKFSPLFINPLRQSFHNLMGLASGDPAILTGEVLDEGGLERTMSMGLMMYSFSAYPRLLVRYFFGDFSDASMEVAKLTRKTTRDDYSPLFTSIILLVDGLFCIARARKKKLRWTPYANKCSHRIRRWAVHGPYHFLGKHLLLDAEISSLSLINRRDAFPKYIAAISVAKESGSLMEQALANELTAKYLLREGNEETADKYIRESILTYIHWGAIAKADHLRTEMASHGYNDLPD